MPLVRSNDILPDGFRIVTTRGGTFTISSADLTAGQRAMTPAQVESIANSFLATRLTPLGMFVKVHLTSVVPLRGTPVVADKASYFAGDWWT